MALFFPDLRSPQVSGGGIQGGCLPVPLYGDRKPLCGLDPDKKYSFMNWKRHVSILQLWTDTIDVLLRYPSNTQGAGRGKLRFNLFNGISKSFLGPQMILLFEKMIIYNTIK